MTTQLIEVPRRKTALEAPTVADLEKLLFPDLTEGFAPDMPQFEILEDAGVEHYDDVIDERQEAGDNPFPDLAEHRSRMADIEAMIHAPYEAEATFVTQPGDLLALAPTPLLDMRAEDTLPRIEYDTEQVPLRFPQGFDLPWRPEPVDDPLMAKLLGTAYAKAAWAVAEQEFAQQQPTQVLPPVEAEPFSLWGRIKRAWRTLWDDAPGPVVA